MGDEGAWLQGPARVFASQTEACAWHAARLPADCDTAAMLDLAGLWRARTGLRDRLPPGARPMVRADANPTPELTALLARMGCGARVRARGDLQEAISAGIPGSEIYLDNPCKPRSIIAMARRHGVAMTTFDTEAEAARLAELWPEAAALLLVRPAGYEFGEAALGAEPAAVPGILAAASRCGLDIAGVAIAGFGDECDDNEDYNCYGGGGEQANGGERRWAAALEVAKKAAVAGRLLGHRMAVLDLGRVGQRWVLPPAAAIGRNRWPGGVVCDATEALLGRSVVMATRVVAKRRAGGDSDNGWVYTLSDSAFGAFAFNEEAPPLPPPVALLFPGIGDISVPAWLDGSTGCHGGLLGCYGNLPELQAGDWLLWPGRGAAGSRLGWRVNGLRQPEFRCFLQSAQHRAGRRCRHVSFTAAALAPSGGGCFCADDMSAAVAAAASADVSADSGRSESALLSVAAAVDTRDICCSVLLS